MFTINERKRTIPILVVLLNNKRKELAICDIAIKIPYPNEYP
jgi:hypothetical protein